MDSPRELPVSRAFPARLIRLDHPSGPLIFRPTLMSDAEEIHRAALASLPELRRFMPWAHAPRELLAEVERLRSVEANYFSGYDLVMGLFRGSSMLTMVGLHGRVPLNPRGLEVGYWAPTPHAGQGWTTLGVQVASVYAFDRLDCDRLQVSCDEANAPSRRVIDKCGFAHEATLRGMLNEPDPGLIAQGFVHSGRVRQYALFPDTFERLPWVAPLRARLSYVNLLGYDV